MDGRAAGLVLAYDWQAISEQTADTAYYRLLGEMMQNRASARDLQQVREFLAEAQLGDDVWFSLGEALFATTHGASDGYRMWCAWAKSVLGERFDEADQVEAWRQFRDDASEALEYNSDAFLAVDYDDMDDITQRRGGARKTCLTDNPTTAISLIPSGPHTIRAWDEVFEAVDEFAILKLLQRGILFEFEILAGMRWIRISEHPAFEPLMERLKEEALLELASVERARAEVTQPRML